MAGAEDEVLELRELRVGDGVNRLKAGLEFIALSRFLKSSALPHQNQQVSRTYVVVTATSKVVGYITLLCSQIQLSGVPEVNDYPGNDYPAVKIGKLAVENDYRGKDIATRLVKLSLGITKDHIQSNVGCRFLVVDSHQSAIAFYLKMGFTLLDTDVNKARPAPTMFIDLMRV